MGSVRLTHSFALCKQPRPSAVYRNELPPRATAGKTVELALGGMTCGNCAARIEAALSKVPGVTSAAVDLSKNKAMVAFGVTRYLDDDRLQRFLGRVPFRLPVRQLLFWRACVCVCVGSTLREP